MGFWFACGLELRGGHPQALEGNGLQGSRKAGVAGRVVLETESRLYEASGDFILSVTGSRPSLILCGANAKKERTVSEMCCGSRL